VTAEGKKLKRFYKSVSAQKLDDGYAILLDGRAAKTAGRNMLVAPTDGLGAAIAEEWDAQGEFIEHHLMPLTALMAGSIDSAAAAVDDPVDEILKFLKTDLVCYRADAPMALAERQGAVWDPYVTWLEATFGARLITTNGIVAVAQADAAINAVRKHIKGQKLPVLHGIKTATEITGSGVLALALWQGGFEPQTIFDASRVDENFQEERWGVDAEAEARAQRLSGDFDAVARFLSLLQ